MRIKCFGCGIEKDTTLLEVCPYPEAHLCDDPIPPLLVVECEGSGGFGSKDGFRACVVCHKCYAALDMDMWIGEACWERLNPMILHRDLPYTLTEEITYGDKWNAESYAVAREAEAK